MLSRILNKEIDQSDTSASLQISMADKRTLLIFLFPPLKLCDTYIPEESIYEYTNWLVKTFNFFSGEMRSKIKYPSNATCLVIENTAYIALMQNISTVLKFVKNMNRLFQSYI